MRPGSPEKARVSYSLSELEAQDLETQELFHSQMNKKQLNSLEKKSLKYPEPQSSHL